MGYRFAARTALTGAAVALAAMLDAAPAPQPAEDLFARKCASCHTVGGGARVGPDLKGVHERRRRDWLEAFIQAPSTKLDSDPDARQLLGEFKGLRMPDLGLTIDDTRLLVALIERCSAEPCQLAGKFKPSTRATDADVETGRALFIGHRALAAGGAPCLSCHTARGSRAGIVGGRFAKDLTHAFARLGDEGLDAALRNPAFPVMSKVFKDHPLDADEAFALRGFLARVNKADGTPDDGLGPVLPALLGTAAALAALDMAWRRRLRGVRRPLTHRRESES